MKFTDRKLLGLKPSGKIKDYLESDGFLVRVYPSGKKVFQFRYTYRGSRRRYTIGEYPHTHTLESARAKHREMYGALKRGEDPEAAGITVSVAYKEFLAKYVKKNNTDRVYLQRVKQYEQHISAIGNIQLKLFGRQDVQKCLSEHRENLRATAHNHLLGTIKKFLNYCIDLGYIDYSVATGIKNMPTAPRQRILTKDEIKKIMGDNSRCGVILQLILLTGQRPGEVEHIAKSAITENWWTVDQKKGKKTSSKRVYLAPAARSLVDRVKPYAHQNGLAQCVKRKYKTFTPHDLRRTAASILAEKYQEELVHRFLGHSVGRLTETYLVYKYDKELKEMSLYLEARLLY